MVSSSCKLQTIPACLAQSILHHQQDLSLLFQILIKYFLLQMLLKGFGKKLQITKKIKTNYYLQMKIKFLIKYLLQMRWRGRDTAVGLLLLVQVTIT